MPRMATLAGVVAFVAAAHVAEAQRVLGTDLEVMVDDGPAEPIGQLRDFAVGRDGRIYVLDAKAQQIHLFKANGAFEKTFSRVGSGPGELREANGILVAPDGTIWVHDHGNLRVTVFTAEGAYQRQIPADARFYGWRWDGAFDAGKRLVHRVLIIEGATSRRYAWQGRDLKGSRADTIPIAGAGLEAPPKPGSVWQAEFPNGRRRMGAYPFREPVTEAFDPAGAVWTSVPGEYRLVKVTLRGDTVAQATRNIRPYPIPEPVRDAAIQRIRDMIKSALKHDVDFANVPRTYAFVGQLAVDERGRVWARRDQADSTITEFDVFSPAGVYQFTAVLKKRIDRYGRLLFARNALYAVALDDDDLPAIVRAPLPQ